VLAAIIFDLDGVLLDSEQRWNEAKEALVREAGGTWREEAPRVMMGMSSPEWSAYLRDDLGVQRDLDAINDDVVRRMHESYEDGLPLLPGALETVRALAARWPLGLASSSNREIIDVFLERSGVGDLFGATVSSEQVARGKPAPDVYLEAAGRLGVAPYRCAAIEDSQNGIRAASSAGMRVIAIPNPAFPPGEEALAAADRILESLDALTVEVVGSRA
jgi:HAD superfamily hydrolase (TIGR01509 family)